MSERAEGISVVIPVHNEEANLPILCERLLPVLDRVGRPFEVILIDDGSTDSSAQIAGGMAASDERIRSIRIEPRSGQSAAFDVGFRTARYSVIVTMDADLQNDPEDIPELLEALEGADAVCGVRVRRRDSWIRRIQSRIANRIRDGITGDRVTDTGCSLKVCRRDYLARLKMYRGMHRFLPTLLRLEGARVVEVPVRHHPRLKGQSKYGFGNRAFSGLRDCMAVRWMRDRQLRYRVREEGKR